MVHPQWRAFCRRDWPSQCPFVLFFIGLAIACASTIVGQSIAPASAASTRLPPPDAAAQARAESEIHEVFRQQYSGKVASDRVKLAKLFLAKADETSDDPA